MAVQVWLGDQPAGALEHGNGRTWRLRYAPEWLAQWRAYPLSPRLPLDGGRKPARLSAGSGEPSPEAISNALALYLGLLLPGGHAQSGLRRALGWRGDDAGAGIDPSQGMDTDDVVTMLSVAGADLPGAVSLRDARANPRVQPHGLQLRALSVEDMARRLQAPPEDRLLLEPGAGQPVLPWWPTLCAEPLIGVYLDQEQWWWTRTPQLASTHLLEAPAPGVAGERLLLNKLFCLRLATRLGLDVAPVELLRLPMPVLQFQRWDRQRLEDGRVRRFHAVSVAQIFGVLAPAAGQLEHRLAADGVSAPVPLWRQLGGLLELSPQPLVDRRALIRWWIFQTLTGHLAASPMDLWCYLDPTGLRLAPVMNLWCPAAQPGPTSGPASGPRRGPERGRAIGAACGEASGESAGSMVPVCTLASDWALVARACGANPRSLAHELRRLCEAAPLEARALASQLRGSMPEDLMQTLVDAITVAAATQLECVDDLLHTDHRD